MTKHLTTDEEINAFLESEGVAESIDTLINLNQENTDLEDINLDEVLEDSLAHYLGDNETRHVIKRVFSIRYSYLRNTLNQKEYGKYLQTGLPLADYNELKCIFEEKTAEDFEINGPIDCDWIHFMIETIYNLSSIRRTVSYVTKSKPLFHIHHDLNLVERIVAGWLAGKQYVEIANTVGCTTEQATLYVDFIQKYIAVKAQAIVTYIVETYQIESNLIQLWPEMVKRGVSDEKALWIIDSGLSDRVVVNLLASYFDGEIRYGDDKELFLDAVTHVAAIDKYVMNSTIPVLLKERWKQYLRSNGVM